MGLKFWNYLFLHTQVLSDIFSRWFFDSDRRHTFIHETPLTRKTHLRLYQNISVHVRHSNFKEINKRRDTFVVTLQKTHLECFRGGITNVTHTADIPAVPCKVVDYRKVLRLWCGSERTLLPYITNMFMNCLCTTFLENGSRLFMYFANVRRNKKRTPKTRSILEDNSTFQYAFFIIVLSIENTNAHHQTANWIYC